MEQFLKTSEIKIGDRVRDDLGDLEALADSIDKNGLIHAIVVDEDKRLIAGGRRLAAVKLLEQRLEKEIRIRAHVLRHISDRKLRVLELEENLQRKDLTELEKSKNLVELAEKKEAEFMTEMAERAKRKGEERGEKEETGSFVAACDKTKTGRPTEVGSIRRQAEILRIPKDTLHRAKQHVEAVEKYPQLEDVPKMQAIRTAKILDLSEQRPVDTVNMTSAEFNRHVDKQFKIAGKISDAVFYLATLETDYKAMQDWLDVESDVETIAENRLDELYGQLQRVIANAMKMQKAIKDWREKHGKKTHKK